MATFIRYDSDLAKKEGYEGDPFSLIESLGMMWGEYHRIDGIIVLEVDKVAANLPTFIVKVNDWYSALEEGYKRKAQDPSNYKNGLFGPKDL